MSEIKREGRSELKLIISPREANELLQGGTVLNSCYVISQDINLENQNLQKENQELKRKLDLAVEALEKYGKFENLIQIRNGHVTHTRHDDDIETINDCGYILKLKGKHARKALKEIKGE